MKKGLFITFEGVDGCGKTTQLQLLAQHLKKIGKEVLVTREPGAQGLGSKIREILLNYKDDISDRCETFLFLADRAQHMDMIVNPAVNEGKIVLCDRHIDSSTAYQGYGRGFDIKRIDMLNMMATNGHRPDLTLVFDIDAETSMKRIRHEKDRMECAGMDFFNRVRKGYLELAKQEPQRIKIIDAFKTIEKVHDDVVMIYRQYLN